MRFFLLTVFPLLVSAGVATGGTLKWPIDCIPQKTCIGELGFPDIDKDGRAHNCKKSGYKGHHGTDIGATKGTTVFAADEGEVLWVFDGKFDGCPSKHRDCAPPRSKKLKPSHREGTTVCTRLGPYCGTGRGRCFWCFAGGNVVVIKHSTNRSVFATRYDHLKTNSVVVSPGDWVKRGQKIAEVGSSGRSSGPHLHFEVWGRGFYKLADPWSGACGPNHGRPMWKHGNEPWKAVR